ALFVLREGFLASAQSAAIGVPAVGLSKLHVEPAEAYVREHGGEVRHSTEVLRLEEGEGGIRGVVTRSRRDGAGEQREAFDGYVLAAPHTRVAAMLPPGMAAEAPFAGLGDIPVAPIVNLHLWFDRPVADWAIAAYTG